MIRQLTMATAGVSLALFSLGASAAQISTSEIVSGSGGGLTFSATGGNLTTSSWGDISGAGVDTGLSEMGTGETITASGNFRFGGASLAFLFDGPEWADTQEMAVLTGTFADGRTSTVRLTNTYVDDTDRAASLFVDGQQRNDLLTNVSEANYDVISQIAFGAVFGDDILSSITFSAESGACGAGPCTDDADYAISSIDATDVPEPGTVAMFGLGLTLIGAGFYRRRQL